jgi:hypothetical protein
VPYVGQLSDVVSSVATVIERASADGRTNWLGIVGAAAGAAGVVAPDAFAAAEGNAADGDVISALGDAQVHAERFERRYRAASGQYKQSQLRSEDARI